MQIEEKAERMHQQTTRQPIAQMPQIARPDAFHAAAIRQLAKDRVVEVADPAQRRAVVGCRLRHVGFAEGRLQIGQPLVAVSQHRPVRSFQQERHDFSIRFIGRSQEDAGDQARPTQLRMQPKAIKRLTVRMIIALAGEDAKARSKGQTGNGTLSTMDMAPS